MTAEDSLDSLQDVAAEVEKPRKPIDPGKRVVPLGQEKAKSVLEKLKQTTPVTGKMPKKVVGSVPHGKALVKGVVAKAAPKKVLKTLRPAPKKAKKAKKAGAKRAPRTPPEAKYAPAALKSKALVSLKLKLRTPRILGRCSNSACNGKTNRKGLWCLKCKKLVRTEQLRLNNITWAKRGKGCKILPKVSYAGKPTVWAREHKEKALQRVRKGKSSIATVKEFTELCSIKNKKAGKSSK